MTKDIPLFPRAWCHWCTSGKPHWAPPYFNRGCPRCAEKHPECTRAVDPAVLPSTAEINHARRTSRKARRPLARLLQQNEARRNAMLESLTPIRTRAVG